MYTCDISFDLVTKNVSGSEKRILITYLSFFIKKKQTNHELNAHGGMLLH